MIILNHVAYAHVGQTMSSCVAVTVCSVCRSILLPVAVCYRPACNMHPHNYLTG